MVPHRDYANSLEMRREYARLDAMFWPAPILLEPPKPEWRAPQLEELSFPGNPQSETEHNIIKALALIHEDRITCLRIQRAVVMVWGTTRKEILSYSRFHIHNEPRAIAMALCRMLLPFPTYRMGEWFERDHTSVINAVRKYGRIIEGVTNGRLHVPEAQAFGGYHAHHLFHKQGEDRRVPPSIDDSVDETRADRLERGDSGYPGNGDPGARGVGPDARIASR